MKILSVEIRDLVTFQCAKISSLSLVFTDMIQVILGTNGCGKSNLMRQLSPLPPTRSDFLSGTGYKKLVIEHEGVEYTLISDFSKKDSPHEFCVGGTNINDGGTTEVQRELVVSRLGWTPDVEALCFNSFNFAGMGSAQREALFMKLNPYKINFILENGKKVKSRIRGCKTMLARLQERKVRLESQLLPEDNIKSLQEEQTMLLERSAFLSKMQVKTESALTHIKRDGKHSIYTTDPKETLDRLLSDLKSWIPETHFRMESWSKVDRKSPEAQQEKLSQRLAALDAQQAEYLNQIEGYVESLRKDNENLADCVDEDFITRLNSQLLSLEGKLSDVLKISPENPFSADFVAKAEPILEKLGEILSGFTECPNRLLTRKAFSRKSDNLRYWNHIRCDIARNIQLAEEEIEQQRKVFRISPDDIPSENCAKSACPLFNSFMSQNERSQKIIQRAEEQIRNWTPRVKKIARYLDAQDQQIKEQRPYQQLLVELFTLIQDNPELHQFFSRPDTLALIARNPNGILMRIRHHFTGSKAALEVPKIKEELLKAQLEYSKYKSLSDKEKTHLTSMIEETTKKLEKVRKKFDASKNESWALKWQVRHIKAYLQTAADLAQYQTLLSELEGELTRRHEISKLNRLRDCFTDHIHQTTHRLSDIQRVIKDQESLWDRYREEVLSTITEIELEKASLEQIGEALDALPQEYTTQFMNRLFKSTNAFVSKVFTYKLALFPMVPERSKSFKFPYTARGTEGPDISKCSTAQMDILNLCLTLACRQSEGLGDYPIFLDEVGRTFDPTHQQNLLELFLFICDEHLASQLFIVNHHAVIHGGLMNTETLVLDDTNVMKTERYNTHVVMESY